jgi:hypothetical protein
MRARSSAHWDVQHGNLARIQRSSRSGPQPRQNDFRRRAQGLAKISGVLKAASQGASRCSYLLANRVGKEASCSGARLPRESLGRAGLGSLLARLGGWYPSWSCVQALRYLMADAEPATLSGWLGAEAAEIAQIASEVRERIGGCEPPRVTLAPSPSCSLAAD